MIRLPSLIRQYFSLSIILLKSIYPNYRRNPLESEMPPATSAGAGGEARSRFTLG